MRKTFLNAVSSLGSVLVTTAFAAIVTAAANAGNAATFTVNSILDGPHSHDVNPGDGIAEDDFGKTTLRAAIEEANALAGADVINFSTALAPDLLEIGDGSIDSEFTIAEDLTINGLGSDLPIVPGGGAAGGRLFKVSASVTFEVNSLVVSGWTGDYGNGGVFLNQGVLILNDCELLSCGSAFSGGAIYNDLGTLTIDACLFDNCLAGGNGGAIETKGACGIFDSSFTDNDAAGDGGALYATLHSSTDVEISTCVFEDNAVTGYGGAISNWGDMTIDDFSVIESNTSTAHGGGIYNSLYGSLLIKDSTIRYNVVLDDMMYCGGGIYNAGSLTVGTSTIALNSPDDICP